MAMNNEHSTLFAIVFAFFVVSSAYIGTEGIVGSKRCCYPRISMRPLSSGRESFASRKKEYRSLRPIASLGKYTYRGAGGVMGSNPSLFLGLRRMEVVPLDEEEEKPSPGSREATTGTTGTGSSSYIARNIIPVPIRQEFEGCFQAAMALPLPTTTFISWPKGILTDRDGGVFDWLLKHPFFITEDNARIRRKYMYDYINSNKPPQKSAVKSKSKSGGAGIQIQSIFSSLIGQTQTQAQPGDTQSSTPPTATSAVASSSRWSLEEVASRASDSPPLDIDASISPYHEMLEALDTTAGLRVAGLLLEVLDRPSSGAVITAGAVLLVPSQWDSSLYNKWILKSSTASSIIKATQSRGKNSSDDDTDNDDNDGNNAFFVKCHADELVGFAAALANPHKKTTRKADDGDNDDDDDLQQLTPVKELPIVVESSLFGALAIDGLIQKVELAVEEEEEEEDDEEDSDDDRRSSRSSSSSWEVRVTAPFYSEAAKRRASSSRDSDSDSSSTKQEKNENDDKQKKNESKKATLESASDYLTMSIPQKREWLRTNGVRSYMMPRPREGIRALDAAILPLLDLELTYEILRRLGEAKGDAAAAAEMADFQSNKPLIARQIIIAQAKGDDGKVKELTAELNSLSTLSYNPFEPDAAGTGTTSVWDVEKWYWEERQKRQQQRRG